MKQDDSVKSSFIFAFVQVLIRYGNYMKPNPIITSYSLTTD